MKFLQHKLISCIQRNTNLSWRFLPKRGWMSIPKRQSVPTKDSKIGFHFRWISPSTGFPVPRGRKQYRWRATRFEYPQRPRVSTPVRMSSYECRSECPPAWCVELIKDNTADDTGCLKGLQSAKRDSVYRWLVIEAGPVAIYCSIPKREPDYRNRRFGRPIRPLINHFPLQAGGRVSVDTTLTSRRGVSA